ncbi:Transducin/WD40 repeat-like superfamily protein [Striga hermonthica]|uniref:Transducin/WD40 repeat-like superfamily protein n=1 Tax=Striga hermonthica TaxID=68872 RepID=A0A9N7N8Y7_STRHE|nr:Transducin/WD40 repeat-like superfamily protein [Striga hermonthica]
MSTSSARLLKERTVAAAAGKISPAAGKAMSTGKENPRPTSRVRAATQKPMARIDKSAVEESRADPRVRKSSSSVPRGRSSSPYQLTRGLSDSRNNSRASFGPPQKKVNTSFWTEQSVRKYNLRNRVSSDLGSNGKSEILVEKNAGNRKKEGNLSSISVLNPGTEKRGFKCLENNEKGLDDLKANYPETINTSNLRSSRVRIEPDSRSGDCKMATSKYPSKLHEKLAFLEGKVKRIADEIQKTKEMLDSTNPDTSKMIMSSIHEKISGIEKAMGVVERNGDDNMVSADNGENEKDSTNAKSLINGTNVDELEGRLFPHDKLIRDRKISKIEPAVDNSEVIISFDCCLIKKGTKVSEVHEGGDDAVIFAAEGSSMNVLNGNDNIESLLMADENLEDFDDSQHKKATMMFDNEIEENCVHDLSDIGSKISTGGWFVSEGESVLLAHDDGSCSFYDVANSEEKALYKPPAGILPNTWRDCWLIRAPSADGCSGKYVVAASAGNSLISGFCSWDFYTKDIRAFHLEDETTPTARIVTARTALAPLPNNTMYNRRDHHFTASESRQWWYKPCGPLIMSAASCGKAVQIFDIRDGDRVMRWELPKPVLGMDYSVPLHWRNKGKVVIAVPDGLCLWDVGSLDSRVLMSVSSGAGRILALHVNNSDAEIGGGVRQRISSSEAEGNDGVFCTSDSICVLDFRQPSGIALKISNTGLDVQSAFSRGDSIYIGCQNNSNSSLKNQQPCSQILQFSLRKQRLMSTYTLPESSVHNHFMSATQVWGNSSLVMGVCGLGLFVFDSFRDDVSSEDPGCMWEPKEIIGPDDMYAPSFDYSGSRVLVISRDRPACWRYLF